MGNIGTQHLKKLEAIHQEVDGLVVLVEDQLGERLVCRHGCSDCCEDNLTVLEIEAELIRQNCEAVLRQEPAPSSQGCAFLDPDGGCRVYPWRPYICRTQGLPLRWLESEDTEGRDICPLNQEVIHEMGEDINQYPHDHCWTLGPWEGRLASLQAEASGRFEQVRIPLRSLFISPEGK